MYKTIDLFAGAGGLSYGFMQTGKFKILAAAEINKNAQETYKRNIANFFPGFVFIDNVIGYDFKKLSKKFKGIDVVIGGPPCQGFSNANRQKNHLISMNNGLVKEYFRAIKEIRPKAFVMENVSMLRSEVHRFYESSDDYQDIENLINAGFNIPKRKDIIVISEEKFEGIDINNESFIDISHLLITSDIMQLLNVLNKNINNERKLANYLLKQGKTIVKKIELFNQNESINILTSIKDKLNDIKDSIQGNDVYSSLENLKYIVNQQKALQTIKEIQQNKLLGQYKYTEDNKLVYEINSYSVIDYVSAILGGEYIQVGDTLNAEYFGVPQERRRYVIIGIRKDCVGTKEVSLPQIDENIKITTTGEAILDLMDYKAEYEPNLALHPYNKHDKLSTFAILMRKDSEGVVNHFTTKTTPIALERFKAIEQGKNFHSLDKSLKGTYSKPERTQNTIYLRLNPSEPSGTVVNVRKSMWIHPILDRAITVREAARLQSFPDKFVFIGSKDSQYQQVGNAVPPLLARAIAEQILKYI
ncbi:MAG: DNA cytosine methyltransferase [Alphaproteobacteria bacterium]|nr:DNA cytosine methyltransferase [Alphaproteobacteria bacterium]